MTVLLIAPHAANFAKKQAVRTYKAAKAAIANRKAKQKPVPALEIDKFLPILEVGGDANVLEPLYIAVATYVDNNIDTLGVKPTSLKMTSEAGVAYTIPVDAFDANFNKAKLKIHFKNTYVRIEGDLQHAMAFAKAAKQAYRGGKEMTMYS